MITLIWRKFIYSESHSTVTFNLALILGVSDRVSCQDHFPLGSSDLEVGSDFSKGDVVTKSKKKPRATTIFGS